MIRFVDIIPNKGTNDTFMAKEITFPNEIYNYIHEFIDATIA